VYVANHSVLFLSYALALAQAAGASLQIEVIQGDGAIHNVQLGRGVEPVIRVLDEHGEPVQGAAVTFLLPETGPGGRFPHGSVYTTATNETGQAVARELRPNRLVGQWEIRVAASHGGLRARAIIQQTNATPLLAPKERGKSRTLLMALIGGGAAAGLAAALGGGGGGKAVTTPTAAPATPASIPTTIAAGPASIGRP
jgi:hypothetical protein